MKLTLKTKLINPAIIVTAITLSGCTSNKNYLSAHKIQVAGHADAPGSPSHNQTLDSKTHKAV